MLRPPARESQADRVARHETHHHAASVLGNATRRLYGSWTDPLKDRQPATWSRSSSRWGCIPD